MLISKLLLDILDDMGQGDFARFRWFLSQPILENFNPIPRGIIEKANQTELVTEMTGRYGDHSAVKITIAVLEQLDLNGVAEKLKNKYEDGLKAASCSSSSSSAASTPATAGPSVSARDGSVVIAPTISCGSTMSGNVTINVTTPAQK